MAAGALALLAVLQMGWSRPIALPPADAITPVRLDLLSLTPVRAPAGARALFATEAGPAATTAVQPLNGAKAVGIATRGGRSLAFVQSGEGRVLGLGLGQFVAGWQLVGIGADALRFRRGGEAVSLPIGGGGSASTPAARGAQ